MTGQPETLDALRGVALLNAEEPTGLRITTARVPEGDLPRLRDAVDAARQTGLGLKPGENVSGKRTGRGSVGRPNTQCSWRQWAEQHPVRWTAFVSVSCCHLALG